MIDIIGQPGRPATPEEIEAYLKDCNGCFGAAGNDCQKCQEHEGITDEQAVAALNTLVQYCGQTNLCNDCVFHRLGDVELFGCGTCEFAGGEGIILPAIRVNTVYYFQDGQLKRTTCGNREEAEKLLEEKKREKRRD